ncbi:MAG: crossover junction endodeoxyribonuclease RuvC [Acidobacteriota bacterium]
MIILGVDPGTLVTGFGVVERQGTQLRMIECGAVVNAQKDPMPLRLKAMYDALCGVIARTHPDEFALETAFYGKNIQSSLKIGQARGVAMLTAANSGIPLSEYAPREIKRAVTGNGAATKEQVQFMVMKMLRLRTAPDALDVSDALAAAITHANRIGSPRTGHTSWESYIAAHPERVITRRQ